MHAILALTLCLSVLLFSQSLSGFSRQAASEEMQEKKGKWVVKISVHEPNAKVSSSWGGILDYFISNTYEEESVSATVDFNYISKNGSNPTPVSTTCVLSESSSGFLGATLKPKSGASFNLYFSHFRLLTCSQKNEKKEGFLHKEELATSLPYDITKKTNTKIEGEIIASHKISEKVSASSIDETVERIVGEKDTLVFPPKEYQSGVFAHTESYSTKANKDPSKNESSGSYTFIGTVKICNIATDAITTINSSMSINEKSVKGILNE